MKFDSSNIWIIHSRERCVTEERAFRTPSFDHEWIEFGETTLDQVVERLRGATIAICNKVQLAREALSQLPEL